MFFPSFSVFAVRNVENLLQFAMEMNLKSFTKQYFHSHIAVCMATFLLNVDSGQDLLKLRVKVRFLNSCSNPEGFRVTEQSRFSLISIGLFLLPIQNRLQDYSFCSFPMFRTYF